MKNLKIAVLALAIVFALACKETKKEAEDAMVTETEAQEPALKEMTIALTPKSESNVEGSIVFNEVDGVVSMLATMTRLTEGSHAIHIHETADCSSEDGKSTGGHWNPTAQPHGKWGDATGYHKGDIGNFEVAADGIGNVEFSTDQWCIGCGDENKDILGKAIIVHQGTDDFTSQPSGDAGARVSCAGIIE
jgi:Cu-Zn family superoxide dismutase